MGFERWENLAGTLRAEYLSLPAAERDTFRGFIRIEEFVNELARPEKVPLLIYAYEHYRDVESATGLSGDDYFWSRAYAILIAQLLSARLHPSDAEACLILGVACRRVAKGADLLQPIRIAERTFAERPYPADLFDSARAYRETLEPLKLAEARKAKKTLDLLLWHDVRRPARGCWSARIQKSIATMDEKEAFGWQWLLRNASPGVWKSGGTAWADQARKGLTALGEDRFLRRLDEWFQFADAAAVRVSVVGNHFLGLLVLYAGLVDRQKARPILERLMNVGWSQRGRMRKVAEGIARIIG